ncbi:hypothetical protein PIROE2DRAFT_62734 [Piromyces sp. E2]|nr:hypothetical protein PIROE2DRAFT_62734 [Piromyces sp. E2]|eukprot:OUM61093.1 hypothetical protein PIROE2DRAFT_62734 [Piromyces sp. E2]
MEEELNQEKVNEISTVGGQESVNEISTVGQERVNENSVEGPENINENSNTSQKINIEEYTDISQYEWNFSKITTLQELIDIFKGQPAYKWNDCKICNITSYNGGMAFGSAYLDENNMKNPGFNVKNLTFVEGVRYQQPYYDDGDPWDENDAPLYSIYHYMSILTSSFYAKEVRTPCIRLVKNWLYDEVKEDGIDDIEIHSLEEVNKAVRNGQSVFSGIVNAIPRDTVCLNLRFLNEEELRYLKVFSSCIIDLSNQYSNKKVNSAITKPMTMSNAKVLDDTLIYQDIEFGPFFCLDYLHWGTAQKDSILEIPSYDPIEGIISYFSCRSNHFYQNVNKAHLFQYARILKTYCMQEALAQNYYMATVKGNDMISTDELTKISFINNISSDMLANYEDAPAWIPYELSIQSSLLDVNDISIELDDDDNLVQCNNGKIINTKCKCPNSFYVTESSYQYSTVYDDSGPVIHLNQEFVRTLPDTVPYNIYHSRYATAGRMKNDKNYFQGKWIKRIKKSLRF